MPRPSLRLGAVLLAGTAALAACMDQPAAPIGATVATRSVEAAGLPGTRPQHLVVFQSPSGVPKGFAEEVAALGGTLDNAMGEVGAAVVGGLSDEAVARLRRASGVASVDADVQFTRGIMRGEPSEHVLPDAELNSPTAPQTAILYGAQWNMRAVMADSAWKYGKLGSAAVTVAILDSGVDPTGVDLNGRVDLARSKSFVAFDDSVVKARFPTHNAVTDLDGHGTNVAAQVASNGIVFAGVTSKTKLMAVKVCSILDFCSTNAVFQGIVYAVQNGADIINMSLGGGFLKPECTGCISIFNRVLKYAKDNGVTVVVSSGNESHDLDHDGTWVDTYCSIPNVICVAATGPTSDGGGLGPFVDVDAAAEYSNHGRSAINVAAPGGNVKLGTNAAGQTVLLGQSFVYSLCSRTQLSLQTNGQLLLTTCSANPNSIFLIGYRGTSQAAPHVSGLAALLVERYGRNPAQIRAAIQQSADDLGPVGTDPFYGKGRINVARALGII